MPALFRAYFTQKGVRDEVTITYVTSLDGAFGTPVLAGMFSELLAEKNVELVTGFESLLLGGGWADGGTAQFVGRDGQQGVAVPKMVV